MSELSRRMARWWAAVVLIAVVAAAAGVGQTSFGQTILRKAGLAEEPASYTSLAFVHPQSLDEQLKSTQASVGVSFVIHNAASASRDYRWSVLLIEGKRSRRVAAGDVHVSPGRGSAISRSVEITCTQGRVRVVVNLARPAEFIDAWTACSPHRS